MVSFISPNTIELFGANDSETIQNAISAAIADGCRKVVIPRYNLRTKSCEWRIVDSILIPNDFTIVLDNCYMVQENGTFCPMFTNENSSIRPQTLELEQHDITILGEGNVTLSGGEHNGLVERSAGKYGLPTGISLHNPIFLWINVRRLCVENLHIEHQRHWAINHIYCNEVKIKNIDFFAYPHVPNMDGIDLRKGCQDFEIENITGRTGDDTIALTAISGVAETGATVEGKSHDICNVKIRNVLSDAFNYMNLRLLAQDGNKVHHIDADTIMDTSEHYTKKKSLATVSIGTQGAYIKICPPLPEDISNVHIKNLYSRAGMAIRITNGCTDSLFENFKTFGTNVIGIGSSGFGVTTHNVVFDGFYHGCGRMNIASNLVDNPTKAIPAITDLQDSHGELIMKDVHAEGINRICNNSGTLSLTMEDAELVDYGELYGMLGDTKLIINGKEYSDD